MIVCLDSGNSRIKWGVHDGRTWLAQGAVAHADAPQLATLPREWPHAVKVLLAMAITACNRRGKYIGICGQGPSDHPDLAEWLMQQGITSMSLNPDTVVATWQRLGGQV